MKKLILILPVLFFFGCGEQQKNASTEDLKVAIQALIEDTEGDFGIAFKLLDDSGSHLLINEKEVFHAASTMKTPVMIEIFKQAGSGKFSLDDSILIVNEFRSIVDGSPYSMDLGVDSQEGLYERIGEKATVYELMYQMIIKSSNLATNILIEEVGAENVTQTMRDLGAADIEVLRGVEDLKAFDAGLSNTTTALDMMLIMEAIASGEAVGQEESRQMMDILYDQYYKDLIPKLLPKEVKIAHKTGSITGVQHDAAILTLPDGKQYVLVILTKNLTDVEAGKEAIAEISKMIYDFVNGNYS
ncbi:serine hydrolase [Cyclobacterium plantarum]|uniref:beta-lactamase n=1 Tax=Cyclobacterium plantarum TaxID=2716263 RepID=A0ABX0H7V6_9BACT|nr:serine hydrolase [Cyclobacterium plantarum]NHE57975.1 serine hydrolase [Cyclobacterium plantarum]